MKKTFTAALAAGVVMLATAASAQTETIRLTIGSSHPPVIPWVLAMKNTVVAKTNKALEAKGSKYRIDWNEAYGGALYNFENTLEAVEQGITDFGWVGTLWEPAKMPLQNIMFATPFTNDNPDVAAKVMHELMAKSPAFKKEWETNNAVYFAATTSDSYQLFTKFPVTKLEDLKGRKILAAGAVGAWVEGLGATFVNSGIPAMYNSLQTGVGEGVVLIPSGAIPIKLHEVAPYVTYVNMGAVTFGAFAVNKKKWDSLPKEVQDVMRPIAMEYAAENIKIVKARETAGLERIKKEGAKISTLPEAERKRWADAMPNLAKKWVEANEKPGVPAKQLMQEYMAAMRAAGAKPARDWDKGL
ncbi:MAG: C4-dicarboxylate TRAP transporter substrate-binding protein [Pseudolabrys sp.]